MDSFSGVINIYKEKGYTSHDVVNIVRKTLNRIKTGHTGTLDPMAEGVLPVCIGKATKIADFIQGSDKIYSAVMRLGITTDTEDVTGNVLMERHVETDEDTLKQVVSSFYGKQYQTPPMYSAIKINGKKLYKAAREGINIERPQREIFINEISVTAFDGLRAEILVNCGKGTYIRTLIKDIGEKLGCGACMEELTRLKSGKFCVSDSIKLDDFKRLVQEGKLFDVAAKVEDILDYPRVSVIKEAYILLKNGNPINVEYTEFENEIKLDEKYLLYDFKNELCGVYISAKSGEKRIFKPEIILF